MFLISLSTQTFSSMYWVHILYWTSHLCIEIRQALFSWKVQLKYCTTIDCSFSRSASLRNQTRIWLIGTPIFQLKIHRNFCPLMLAPLCIDPLTHAHSLYQSLYQTSIDLRLSQGNLNLLSFQGVLVPDLLLVEEPSCVSKHRSEYVFYISTSNPN